MKISHPLWFSCDFSIFWKYPTSVRERGGIGWGGWGWGQGRNSIFSVNYGYTSKSWKTSLRISIFSYNVSNIQSSNSCVCLIPTTISGWYENNLYSRTIQRRFLSTLLLLWGSDGVWWSILMKYFGKRVVGLKQFKSLVKGKQCTSKEFETALSGRRNYWHR